MWALTKIRKYVNIDTLKLIYYSLAYSHIQYCISSWGGASKSALQPLVVKQKLLVRIILKQPYDSHTLPLFNQLEFLRVNQIYHYKIGTLMYKNITGSIKMPQTFFLVSEVHNYNTRARSNKNYVVPQARIILKQSSFAYRGPEVWNSIPTTIRETPFFANFKNKFKLHLLQQQT